MTTNETPPWQEPVRGFYTDPGQFVALSGLDYLRSLIEGGSLPPPNRRRSSERSACR